MSPPLVEVRDLTKVYHIGGEEVRALDRVNLKIDRGEFVAVMGPSGSGKSTFMHQIGCLDLATSGEVLLNETPTLDLDSDALAALRNRTIGFVFQQFNLLARTSARDNVAVPLIYGGVPRHERLRRAEAKLEAVGLADRMDHTPACLSGGQQQRVAIARALVSEPLLLLSDEPTGALDSATSTEILRLFRRLNEDGMTVVLVTHEPDVARWAKRRVFFRDGCVVEDTPVLDRMTA